MSKSILVSMLLALSTNIFAYSELNLGDPQDTLEFNTQTSIYRDEISYEPYESTCYRDVYDGTRTVCDTVYETRCTKKPYECHQEPTGESCSEETVYRSEAYSCTEYRKVVTPVYDHSVQASITVVKDASAQNFDLKNCRLSAQLNDFDENFYAYCKTAIVKFKINERGERLNGRNKERKIKLTLDFSSMEDLAALKEGLSNLHFANGLLTFNAADLATAKNFRLDLKIIRNKFLRKDTTVLNKELTSGDFSSTPLENGKFLIAINLKNLASKFDSTKKNTVYLSLKTVNPVNLQRVINSPALTNELNDSLIVKEK